MSGVANVNGRIIRPMPATTPANALPPNPTVTINGKQINAQRIAPLTSDRNVATQSIRNNGIDELIVHQNGHDYLIAGSGLNLREMSRNRIPDIRLNGAPAQYVDHDDEVNSVFEGALQGARNGWRDLADTTIGAVRTAVGTLGAGGTIAVVGAAVGGSVYYTVRAGAGAGASAGAKTMMQAATRGLMSGGLTTMKVIGIAALAGAGVVTIAGAIRGASETSNTRPNWGTLSTITNGTGATPTTQPAPINSVPVYEPSPVSVPVYNPGIFDTQQAPQGQR